MPVKPLTFKGDKKPKKRKHREHDSADTPTTTAASNNTTDQDPTEDDSWTTPDAPTDLSGPTVLILPTNPPTCLASDAHGNIFASQLENIVEGHAETAEPHDVRQVWIANRVVGTGEVSFKASHGGYLSCDSRGILGARREARGVEEGFVVEDVGDDGIGENGRGMGRWRVKTAASGEGGARYLSAVVEEKGKAEEGERRKVEVSLRGDGEVGEKVTEIVIKMQARFKPRLQANKETKRNEKVSRKELEVAVGRSLGDEEVKRLKRARRNGTYHEEVLDVRVKGKHDKWA